LSTVEKVLLKIGRIEATWVSNSALGEIKDVAVTLRINHPTAGRRCLPFPIHPLCLRSVLKSYLESCII
jgi:hypothetical protein